MRTEDKTLVKALRILARDVQSDDGVANAVIGEAADRIEEQGSTAAQVQQLIEGMDHKFTRWDIYRAALGHWCLRAEQLTQICEINKDNFVEVLQEALEWRALPLVPRPKERLYREHFKPKKDGSKWRMTYLNRDIYISVSTKREAEAFADRQAAQSKVDCDAWESEYSWTRDKVEGVDFRWAR